MMNRFKVALLLPTLLLPFVSSAPASPQERQGCFMVTASGRLVDLPEICPTPMQVEAGLGTGDIQVTLRWASTDDLDLAVTDPSGDAVSFFNPRIPSDGQLDVDANAGCDNLTSTPIENVFWPPSEAPQGEYSIAINLYTRCQGSAPVPFTLTLLVQGTTKTLTGTVDEQNPVATFPFSLPLQANSQSQ